MANDITTLAIQIQSQEAERSLQTFNALMLASSQAAAKISNIAVNVDVSAAMAQIQALKSAAAGIKNLNIDSGIAVPTGTIAPTGITPDINVEALNELKNFFATTNSMSKQLREEMQLFDDAVKKLETTTVKVNTTGGRTVQVSKEYAAALREVVAAQKEMEQAIARADADGQAVIEADNKAAAIKQRLLSVQRELQKVTAALNDTHRTYSGNIMGLAQQEEALKNKVDELSVAYRKAQEEADKLGKKLDKSAAQADNARHKYQEAKETLDATPEKPMTEYSQGLQNFSDKAKLAGVQITKLASGINGITMMAGDAIPGISGLGRAISMFGMMNPYIATFAVAIGAAVATYNEYNKIMQDTAVAAREMATEQAKVASNFRKEAQERQNAIDRLTVLNSYDKLYDSEKEESRKIVERLTNAYKDLGIQYDELTGKVTNLSEVTANMGEQDRKRMIEEQREAVRLAKSAAATQLAESQRESVGWWKNLFTGTLGMDGGIDISIPDVRWNFDKNEPEIVSIPITTSQSAQGYADSQYDYINTAKSIEEKIDRVN